MRDNMKCQICGVKTRFFNSSFDCPVSKEPKSGSVDHIIPFSKGGNHNLENLRWACKTCNCSRGNRD